MTPGEENTVALTIGGRSFEHWTQIELTRSIDSIDTATFSAPFDPERLEMRELFKPFSYVDIGVVVNSTKFFTGTMITPEPSASPDGSLVAPKCYATAGVLNDCTPSAGAYPLEFDNMDVGKIAASLCGPFGIPVLISGDVGPVFESVAVTVGTKILSFLAGLAKQRGLLLRSTSTGGLELWAPDPDAEAVVKLTEGDSPLLSVTPRFSPQEYYSDVTGMEPAIAGFDGGKYTVRNSALAGMLRPTVFMASDGEGADVQAATEAKASRMFGAVASYVVELNTWNTPAGALWAPGDIVRLEAPRAMIYKPYDFLIRRVSLRKNPSSETATLELAIPCSFSGTLPEALPWD